MEDNLAMHFEGWLKKNRMWGKVLREFEEVFRVDLVREKSVFAISHFQNNQQIH